MPEEESGNQKAKPIQESWCGGEESILCAVADAEMGCVEQFSVGDVFDACVVTRY